MSSRIPNTDSIQELARFWDAHDLTEFEDQLEEVTEPVFEREAVVSVHLPQHDAEAVKQLAQAKGIAEGELIREWVLEKVQSS